MRFVKGMLALGAAVSFCMAQITGTVVDSLNSPPYPGATANVGIAGATVTLKSAGTHVTTDISGNFTLPTTNVITSASQVISPDVPSISPQGEIRLNLQEPAQVAVKTYSAQGKLIGSVERTLGAGNHSIMPAQTNSGIYVYRVAVNGNTYILQQTNVNGRAYGRQQAENGGTISSGLSKSLAFPDSIVVSKVWYLNQSKQVASGNVTGLTFRMKAFAQDLTSDGCTSSSFNSGVYDVYNNEWNTKYTWTASCPINVTGICNSSCLFGSSYNNWYQILNMEDDAHNGECKAYQSVQDNYNPPIYIEPTSAQTGIAAQTVDFATSTPHGVNMDYETAFDIWVNGVANNTCSEFMMWVDNWHQTPSGTQQTAVTIADGSTGGRSYVPWIRVQSGQTSGYLCFVPTTPFASATAYNTKAFYDYAFGKNWIGTAPQLYQLSFGFETVSTNHYNSAFVVSNYEVHDAY